MGKQKPHRNRHAALADQEIFPDGHWTLPGKSRRIAGPIPKVALGPERSAGIGTVSREVLIDGLPVEIAHEAANILELDEVLQHMHAAGEVIYEGMRV